MIVRDDLTTINKANKSDSAKESCLDKEQEEPSIEQPHESRTIGYYLNNSINKKTIDNWVKNSGINYTPKGSKGKKKKKEGETFFISPLCQSILTRKVNKK